jgi:hypothetical protein
MVSRSESVFVVIASEAKQSNAAFPSPRKRQGCAGLLRRFAPRNDGVWTFQELNQ